MKSTIRYMLVLAFFLSCMFISSIVSEATTWHSFNVSWDVTIGTGSGRVVGRDRIVVGDTVKFSGTRNVTDLREALLTIDRSGAQGYWQDSGATTVYQKSGVVKGDVSNWAMTDNTAFSTTTPGCYRILCWSNGVPSPITIFYVMPSQSSPVESVKLDGESVASQTRVLVQRNRTLTLTYDIGWTAMNSYVSIGVKTASNWPDIPGWAGREFAATNKKVSITLNVYEIAQAAGIGNGTLRITIYGSNGRGGNSTAYVIWLRIGWLLKEGTYSGGTMDFINGSDTSVIFSKVQYMYQNAPFIISATPNSNYYLEKVLITKRHYTSATTYEDTEVVYYNTPTQSNYRSGNICYHPVGVDDYVTPAIDEVIVTPVFKQQKTLAVSVANINRPYIDLAFYGIMVVSYANTGTVYYGTTTNYGHTAPVVASDAHINLTGVTRTKVGTTTVYWKVYVNETYQVKTGSFTITVTKQNVKVTAWDQTIEYGQAPDTLHTAVIATNVAENHVLSAVQYTISHTNVTNNGTITPYNATILDDTKTEDVTDQYQITYVPGKLVITPKPLTPVVNAMDKTYDGTTTGSGDISLTGVVNGDTVTANAASYTFDNKNVGTNKTVTASSITLSGASSGNYSVAFSATGKANITARSVTPSLSAKDKVYDGTAIAEGTLALSNVVSGDSVVLSANSITFDDKNVGTGKTVTATGIKIKNPNYTLSTDTVTTTASITPKTIIPHATANNKTYDTTTAISEGTLYLEGIVGTDIVELQAESFAFDSPLPGNRNADATELSLTGTDSINYILSDNQCTTTATILPHEIPKVSCTSFYVNKAQASLMQSAIQNALPFTLPNGCTYAYGSCNFGTATTDYIRTGDYYDALGKITDTFFLEIRLDGIVIVCGTMEVTTGTNTVYGDNNYNEGTLLCSSILKYDRAWTANATHKATIETNEPTNVNFKVYLHQGEKLKVGTEIGLYYGRAEVCVKQGNSELAKDKIDAFFPVSYEEEYTISDMRYSDVQETINSNRGDYWNAVPEFTASEDGLYSITIHVTGSSYLLDAEKGLGGMYQGNTPADPPETSLRYISIQS